MSYWKKNLVIFRHLQPSWPSSPYSRVLSHSSQVVTYYTKSNDVIACSSKPSNDVTKYYCSSSAPSNPDEKEKKVPREKMLQVEKSLCHYTTHFFTTSTAKAEHFHSNLIFENRVTGRTLQSFQGYNLYMIALKT